MQPDEPTEHEELDETTGDPLEEDPLEDAPRSPWIGRGLIAGALGLWGVVAWMRVGGDVRVQLRPAALVDDDDAGGEASEDDVEPGVFGEPDEMASERGDDEPRPEAAVGDDEDADAKEAAAGASGLEPAAAARAADTTPRDPRERLSGAGWAKDFKPPTKVTYKVKRGGSMKMVANLYKIFHHEIQAWNPGVALEPEQGPGTKFVVWRSPGDDFVSESVGSAGDGSLVGGVPMVDGPGRLLKMEAWKSYATAYNVGVLDAVLRQWAKRFPEDRPLLVGNMSAAKGGRLRPHSTHRSGRDVDLSYPQKIVAGEEEYNWREMSARNLDADRNWGLLELLVESGELEVVLIDSKLQKILYEHAIATGRVAKGELGFWLEYPRQPGTVETIVRHHAGHVDHLHARFKCQPSEGRCRSRKR